MAYSGSKDFAVTRNDIITSAMRKIGVVDAADGAATPEIDAATLTLNAIIKEWTGEGLALWLRKTCVLFLQQNKQVYTVGTNGNGYLVNRPSIFFGELSGSASAGATTLSVADGWTTYDGRTTTSPPAGATVLLRLDNGDMDVRVAGTPTSTTCPVTSGITGAAATGAKVYVFAASALVTRPVRILTAYRLDNSGNQGEVSLIGRVDYEQISRKNASGDPTQMHFDPQIPLAYISVWPVVNSSSVDQIVMVAEFLSDDMDAASNNPEFPIEWANALIWNLAMELSFEYGCDVRTRTQVAQIAFAKKQTLFDTADRENASVTFTVGD